MAAALGAGLLAAARLSVAGQAGTDPAFDAYAFENLGKTPCKVVQFQSK